jgi:hypothetical protein
MLRARARRFSAPSPRGGLTPALRDECNCLATIPFGKPLGVFDVRRPTDELASLPVVHDNRTLLTIDKVSRKSTVKRLQGRLSRLAAYSPGCAAPAHCFNDLFSHESACRHKRFSLHRNNAIKRPQRRSCGVQVNAHQLQRASDYKRFLVGHPKAVRLVGCMRGLGSALGVAV